MPNSADRSPDRAVPQGRQSSRRWRDYETESGRRPVREFLTDRRTLGDECRANVLAAMNDVRLHGVRAARHLRGDIYEVRATCADKIVRVLFAEEGKSGQVLLAIEGFVKKTQQTPDAMIDLAEQRLKDWRSRGSRARAARRARRPRSPSH